MTENFPWFASYPSNVPHEINPDRYESPPFSMKLPGNSPTGLLTPIWASV